MEIMIFSNKGDLVRKTQNDQSKIFVKKKGIWKGTEFANRWFYHKKRCRPNKSFLYYLKKKSYCIRMTLKIISKFNGKFSISKNNLILILKVLLAEWIGNWYHIKTYFAKFWETESWRGRFRYIQRLSLSEQQ